MRQISISCMLIMLVAFGGCAYESRENSPVRILFVGNSVTYYHGVPYLFGAVASELHGTKVAIDFLVQGGGHLVDVVEAESVMNQLAGANYDVVVLQEWGGQLLCAAEESGRSSPSCIASIEAHRRLANVSSAEGAMTVLLGTYQRNEQVARALVVGEKWFFNTLEFDRYVAVAPLLIAGEAEYPLLGWKAEDEVHPGPALSIAMALATAEAVFGPATTDREAIAIRKTREKPSRSLSYEKIENDLSVFYDGTESTYEPELLDSVAHVVRAAD